ncbi:glycoside hydrolase [Aspergillus cavernicola]|uniref:chitinase n=1 Tax=Aspergillus cavernicola TaxID=176166 RepID=A0ABR4HK84_9EURO
MRLAEKPCPNACSATNSPSDWIDYHSTSRLRQCDEPMLIDFAVHAPLNGTKVQSTIFACTQNTTAVVETPASCLASVQEKSLTLELGSWGTADTSADQTSLEDIINSVQKWLGTAADCDRTQIFGYSGNNMVGMYIGRNVQRESAASALAQQATDHIQDSGIAPQVAVQYCGANADYSLGLAIDIGGNLDLVQARVRTWARGECVTGFDESSELSTINSIKVAGMASRINHLAARADTCSTVQVALGDSCAALVTKCGITAAQLTEYNDDPNFCSTLADGQHICCSAGELPDFSPKPYANGTCNTYLVQSGDSCSSLAAANSITLDDLEDFNDESWGWMGCDSLQASQNICLSSGTPPFPSPLANAVCGPQVPGTKQPEDDGPLLWASINPCPLNACCNIWGQCGITPEFCTISESATGNPGTAKAGSNGCIDNCGTTIVNDADPPAEFSAVGYFLGSNEEDRECLNLQAWQIYTPDLTHVQFAFGNINEDYSIDVTKGSDQFERFKALSSVKRVISFGGWDFSTSPDTYHIFREGVTEANRNTLAKNVADFVTEHDLDGVDFDWEYPGAPDIPDIPAGGEDEGDNYVAFLKAVRAELGDSKSISIAAPASFWYLQAFPIKEIVTVVDYIVYMTYDLHGQWDYGKADATPGCDAGNCIRSHVNLTETMFSLAMITKAGAATKDLMVGVSSYGRSFALSEAGCTGPMCTFTGSDTVSDATKGKCTKTAGYLANAEINEIINGDDSAKTGFDTDSDADWMLYDDTQWVGYMSDDTKAKRTSKYKGLSLGGTTDWSVDLQEYVAGWDTDLGGIFTGTAEITVKACAIIQEDDTSASADRNVSLYIDRFITKTLRGDARKWDTALFNDNAHACSNFNAEFCAMPVDCEDYDIPALYWARFVVSNYHSYMNTLSTLFQIALANNTYSVNSIVDDFPIQSPSTIALDTILSNVGSVMSLVAGGMPGVSNSITGALGGIASLIGSNLADDDEDDDTGSVMYQALANILQAGYDSVTQSLQAMFETGDLSKWDSKLTAGEYETDIANFFDGKFMTRLQGTEVDTIESDMNTHMQQMLAGTALVAANYYILKGSHSVSGCTDITSGMVIDDKCFTIEAPGGGYSDKKWSLPIEEDTLKKATDTYKIDLKTLYTSSWDCQVKTDSYEGVLPATSFESFTEIPACFYNLPVFIVEESAKSSVLSSPCGMWAVNSTASSSKKPEVGVTYLPDNLDKIFKQSYCQCSPPTSSYCSL